MPWLDGPAIRPGCHSAATLSAVSGGALTRIEVLECYTEPVNHLFARLGTPRFGLAGHRIRSKPSPCRTTNSSGTRRIPSTPRFSIRSARLSPYAAGSSRLVAFSGVMHRPLGHRRCGAAKRLISRPATMDRALVRQDKALGGGIGRAQRHRSGRHGNVRRDVGLHSSEGLEWLGPCCQLGALAPCSTGIGFAAAKRTAGARSHTPRADDRDAAKDFRPGRARGLPCAPAPAAAALTPPVAPGGPRDVTSAGEGAGAMDFPREGAHRKGHVDLGVGQH